MTENEIKTELNNKEHINHLSWLYAKLTMLECELSSLKANIRGHLNIKMNHNIELLKKQEKAVCELWNDETEVMIDRKILQEAFCELI